MKRHGMKLINGRPRTPRTQGLVEQGNGVVKTKIRSLQAVNGTSEWAGALTLVTQAINLQSHTSLPTTFTPYKALFGRGMPKKKDLEFENDDGKAQFDKLSEAAINEACKDSEDFDTTVLPILQGVVSVEEPDDWIDEDDTPEDTITVLANTTPPPEPQSIPNPAPAPAAAADDADSSPLSSDQELSSESAINTRQIRHHQEGCRKQIAKKYNKRHTITTFQENDIVTLAIPKEDRANTDLSRLMAKIVKIPHPDRHQLVTKFGILDRHYPTGQLNRVPSANAAEWKPQFDAYEQQYAKAKPITLHEAARHHGMADRITISCKCRNGCKGRCTCFKNGKKCTQYCHTCDEERQICGNSGTVLEGTEAAIINRVDHASRRSVRTSTQSATKRRRANTTGEPSTSKGKKAQRVMAGNQLTLSQFETTAVTVERLKTLRSRE